MRWLLMALMLSTLCSCDWFTEMGREFGLVDEPEIIEGEPIIVTADPGTGGQGGGGGTVGE